MVIKSANVDSPYFKSGLLIMNELAKSFGDIFKGKRKEVGLSQDEIALLSGIDRSYVGRIERGEVNISLEKVYLLADVIGCSPKDLLP